VKMNSGKRMVLTLRPVFIFTSGSLVWFNLLVHSQMLM
jgi:hypothetical protein